MGFLTPWALAALPLALVPLLLEWRGRRSGEPVRFSSLYLLERAKDAPRRTLTRSRRMVLLRCLTLLALLLAAARPVGPGRGGPGLHRPTRAIVAVDVSASVAQRRDGRPVWEELRAAADSVLALATADDRVALAAVADGVVGWWEAEPVALRRRLADLAPTARASDWPAALAGLDARAEEGTESYLFTDGAAGGRPPAGARPTASGRPPAGGADRLPGHRALWLPAGDPPPNRGLTAVEWTGSGTVALAGRAWGPGAAAVAEAGRLRGEGIIEATALPLDGSLSASAWSVADTATFALTGEDGLSGDDRLHVAAPPPGRSPAGGTYRVVRWAPGDEPPEPGTLFWEAALAAAAGGARVERERSLAEIAARPPDLALLPLRAYDGDAATVLAALADAGTRLLFAPACPEPACVPTPGWLPGLDAPQLAWRPGPADRQTTLAAAPAGAPYGGPAAAVPEPLVARVPVRAALAVTAGPPPDWTWDLADGAPALWARGSVAVWLVPLGVPLTRLGTTPVFPLVAAAALAAWDPAWSAAADRLRPGDPLPVPPGGARVTGPLHAGAAAREWTVGPGGAPPRPEEPGLYRIEPAGPDVRDPAGAARFAAVRGEPAEGDLTPAAPAVWAAAWSAPPTPPGAWADRVFPRRRGPDLWPWLLALALAGLAAEAGARRARLHK